MVITRIACVVLLCGISFGRQLPQVSTSALPPAKPNPQALSISGAVVNALTGQPVGGARVAIARTGKGADRDIASSVNTGPDGRFAFTGLSRGKYSLMATARGYSLQYFEHHDPYATAIAVGPGLKSDDLVFRLDPDAAIDGTITDDSNEPVQYAIVRLFQRSNEQGLQKTEQVNQAQTDDQGHYHLGHLEPGTYYLAVSARPWYAQNFRNAPTSEDYAKEGGPQAAAQRDGNNLDVTYPLTFYAGALDSGAANPLQLSPGEHATADVSLHAIPSLHLRVHTGSVESPALGHMIFPRIWQRLFEGYLDSVANAPDSWVAPGVIEISGLAPGHYIIEVPASAGAPEKGGGRGWYRELDLAGDADINVSESPSFASVSGVILFPGHVPPHASMQIANAATGENFHADINQRGEFNFNSDNVRPGRYQLGLEAAEGFSLIKLAAAGGTVSGRSIEIGNGASVRISGIATQAAASVSGTAVREGEPFPGAMIVLVPQDPSNNLPLFRRDQSDSDGTFTLPNVVPGQYSVLAIANGWDLEWANPAVLKPYLKDAATIQVAAGGKLDVKVQVR